MSFTTSAHQYPEVLAPYTVTQTGIAIMFVMGFTSLTSLTIFL